MTTEKSSPQPDDGTEPLPHVIEERDAYAKELARCRDAFPIPEPGATHEQDWMLAMSDPLAVADYVTAAIATPSPEGADALVNAYERALKDQQQGFGHWTVVEEARKALLAALAAPAPQAPAWQPIETAPKDGATVLLWESGSSAPFVGAWRSGRRPGWHCDTEHYDTDGNACVISNLWQEGVTHWMPLPAAPQTKEPTNDR